MPRQPSATIPAVTRPDETREPKREAGRFRERVVLERRPLIGLSVSKRGSSSLGCVFRAGACQISSTSSSLPCFRFCHILYFYIALYISVKRVFQYAGIRTERSAMMFDSVYGFPEEEQTPPLESGYEDLLPLECFRKYDQR